MIQKSGQSFAELKKAETSPKQAKDDTDHTGEEKIDIKTDPQTQPELDAKLGLETKEEGDKKAATRKLLDEKKIEKAVSAGQSYAQLKKEDMQKGFGKDLLVGASLAATLAATHAAHEEKKADVAAMTEVPAEHHVGQIYQELDTKAKALKSKMDEVKAKRKPANGKM